VPLITPIILSGGAGKRLWPESIEARPKPFLPLVGGQSTFAMTLDRVSDQTIFAPPVIVANTGQRHLIEAALAEAEAKARPDGAVLLLEPVSRDTAAAIVAAAAFVEARSPGAILLVLPADHIIGNREAFLSAVSTGLTAAESGRIVVFGVRPDRPATSFGYIKPGESLGDAPGTRAVAAFVEKPDPATAARYVDAGYFWNGGMFLMRAETLMAEAARHAPLVAEAARTAAAKAAIAGSTATLDRAAFSQAPKISIDYAVMEKTDRAAVVDAGFDWSDLGTWSAVWEASEKDIEGNAVAGEVALIDSGGNLVRSDGALVGLVGVRDLVVVVAEDAVLVAPRDRADSVKSVVDAFDKRPELLFGGHARHYRPWGYYRNLDIGPTHQVKRIVVKPGARLSLQKHARRAEHWTVVSGIAEVTIGDEVRRVGENETVAIPLGAVHRLSNPGEKPLVLIEVQHGDYFGEDDIVRLEDDYGRG
jgi:mannose-1-phosphate guanylyltransferase/mannose-6-phosphate isomerase